MKKMTLNPVSKVLESLAFYFENDQWPAELIALDNAHGRVLAEDIVSTETVPAFSKSTVDGYAVTFFDAPCVLTAIGQVEMGEGTEAVLREGTCLYVPTGGMLPLGTDTMVMIEDTEKLAGGKVQFNKAANKRENIIEIGADMQIGKMVLSKGLIIDAHSIGAMAALGRYHVPVYKKPRLSIISTGDELTETSDPLKLGQIREINTFTLKVIAEELGFVVTKRQIVKDVYDVIEKAIREALEHSDLVVVSGGSSVGEKDYTYALLDRICSDGVLLNGMAIKPGKPTILAKHGCQPVIGLPGHPVSSIVVFRLLASALLGAWGWQVKEPHAVEAVLEKTIYAASGRDTYQMVWIEKNGVDWIARPTSGKSGMITLLTRSNGYVIIPKEVGTYEIGMKVKAYWF